MKKHCTLLAFVALLLGSVATAHAQSEMAANLDGKQEVPVVTTMAFGQATFDVNFSEGTLGMNYTLSATNLKQAFMAHIHCAPAGVNGNIVMFLAGGTTPGAAAPYNLNGPWVQSAEVTDGNVIKGTMCPNAAGVMVPVNTLVELLTLMAQGLTYVNIHTTGPTGHPGGEIRGQIQLVAPFTIP
jgi:opacity protein-like surface antigen